MGTIKKTALNKTKLGSAIVGSPACGDVMKLDIIVENEVITDAKFKTFGCGSAIASSSLLTEKIIGQSLSSVEQIKNTDLAKELMLPPVKLHCSMLAEDVLKKSIENYRNQLKS